jgi:putative transposase
MDRQIARKLTIEKRKLQTCKVFEVKIDKSKLSQKSLRHLNKLFLEAKWFYNYCLSQKDVNNSNTKIKVVPVKVKNKFENRKLNILRSGMKQAIKTRLFNSLSSLKSLKKNKRKIGKLKFKNRINSIPLKQLNNTYYLDFDKQTIRIQGMKQKLKVVGLKQIPKNYEIANAVLIRKVNDYYIHITTFQNKVNEIIPENSIGIDFGCQTQLTLSNGIKIEFQIPVSSKLKHLDRKIMKHNRKRSNNKYKDQLKREKEYQKLNNKKKDIKNKIVNILTKNYKYICFQDENIHAWQAGRHGKKIQNSGIGGIISDLKNKSVTPIEVSRFFPSTQLCPTCEKKNKLSIKERVYKCSCNYTNDRDIKSAICIEKEGLKNNKIPISNEVANKYEIPVDCRNSKTEEILTSTVFNLLSKIDNIKVGKLESLSQ